MQVAVQGEEFLKLRGRTGIIIIIIIIITLHTQLGEQCHQTRTLYNQETCPFPESPLSPKSENLHLV